MRDDLKRPCEVCGKDIDFFAPTKSECRCQDDRRHCRKCGRPIMRHPFQHPSVDNHTWLHCDDESSLHREKNGRFSSVKAFPLDEDGTVSIWGEEVEP